MQNKQSHLSYLEALLEAEVEERDRRAVIRRIKEAHFPAVKTLEEFDFQSAPHLPVALIKKLSEGQYLERKEPVIFLGETDPATFCTSLLIIENKGYPPVDFRPTGDRFEDCCSRFSKHRQIRGRCRA